MTARADNPILIEEGRRAMPDQTRLETSGERREERGLALILSILALMLLTFLGITLTVTTSTELQIATNYRWSQQALYNAEAGLEVGKRYLRNVAGWGVFLPDPRPDISNTAATDAVCADPRYTSAGPSNEASRSCELRDCDTVGDFGYGVVLWDPTFTTPFQNFQSFFLGTVAPDVGQVSGTFTIWARRPLQRDETTSVVSERQANDRVVLTVEGTAPASGVSAFALANRAVRYLEVTLDWVAPGDCENRTGQIGGGPTGAGFDQCDSVKPEGILGGATEPNPGQQ
jgi:hypothetical protein